MRTYKVELLIRAETDTDAKELLDYTGNETDLKILKIKKVRGDF